MIIAELGINHNGTLSRAISMVKKLGGSYVDYVKVQHCLPEYFGIQESLYEPHPDPVNSFGSTYKEHRENLILSQRAYEILFREIRNEGMKPCASVADFESAKMFKELGAEFIKIPSCKSTDLRLIEKCQSLLPVHVSIGMTNQAERDRLFTILNDEAVVYECTSNYNFGEVFIPNKFEGKMKGFSCHYPDIAFGIYAASKGAEYIEYHVTLSRESKGGDHKISLYPDEIKRMGKSIALLSKIRQRPEGYSVLEETARRKLRND
jgi:sialic acid synthase